MKRVFITLTMVLTCIAVIQAQKTYKIELMSTQLEFRDGTSEPPEFFKGNYQIVFWKDAILIYNGSKITKQLSRNDLIQDGKLWIHYVTDINRKKEYMLVHKEGGTDFLLMTTRRKIPNEGAIDKRYYMEKPIYFKDEKWMNYWKH